ARRMISCARAIGISDSAPTSPLIPSRACWRPPTVRIPFHSRYSFASAPARCTCTESQSALGNQPGTGRVFILNEARDLLFFYSGGEKQMLRCAQHKLKNGKARLLLPGDHCAGQFGNARHAMLHAPAFKIGNDALGRHGVPEVGS